MILWLQFLACSGLILYAGTRLSKYGDIIAEKTNLGRTWIGVVLLASVTSLPEMITGISSVALYDLPNIAVGNVIGACMLNMFMIPFLDLIGGPMPISTKAHQGQVLTAGFGILMLGLVSFSILVAPAFFSIAWVGIYSFGFIAIYLLAMKMLFLYEKKRIVEFVKEVAEEARYKHVSAPFAYAIFSGNALVIVGAATYLPGLAEQIAAATGLGQTFVGSVFVAISTTLPELVVSVAALRMDSVDMAVGNLFGSNLFNITILAIDDILYTKGPLLSHVSANHLISAMAAISMTSVVVIGLTYRATNKRFFIAWDSLGILAIYVLTILSLYLKR